MGRVLAFPRPKSVVALLAVAALLSPQGCSRESTTVLEGVIVGIEAHVPGRPVSLTIDPTEGETTTIDVPERGGYGVPADQLYEWVDERRVVELTYERSDAGAVLTSIRPAGAD